MPYLLSCAGRVLHKMKGIFHIEKIAFVIVLAILTACGDGSSSSESGSGIGGTGVSFLRGNIADVSGDGTVNKARFKVSVQRLLEQAIAAAHAQTASLSGIVVAGGGQSTETDALGNFVLNEVIPSENFILTIRLPQGQSITTAIGRVSPGVEVTLTDVRIDSANSKISIGSKTQEVIEQQNNESSNDNSSGSNENSNNSGEQSEEDTSNSDSDNGAVGDSGPDSPL